MRFCHATLPCNFNARQNCKCDMACCTTVKQSYISFTKLSSAPLHITLSWQCWTQTGLDWVRVLCPIWHKTGHFRDVLPNQSLGLVLNSDWQLLAYVTKVSACDVYCCILQLSRDKLARQNWRCDIGLITGSAVALHCCKAHSKSTGKMETSTPGKIVTPENFILKLGLRDYVEDITHYTNFHVHRFSGCFSTNRWNITLLWLFSCPVLFFSFQRPARTARPIFAVYGSNDVVQPKGGPFLG